MKNILLAYIIKGLSVLIGVLLVRAYMSYFASQAVLGVWYTVLSIVNWFINFDLGIGQGVRNSVTVALAQNNRPMARKNISSGYVTICLVSIVLFVCSSICVYFVDWNAFFRIGNNEISEQILRLSVWITLGGIIAQLTLKLISAIFNAMEHTALSNALTLSTNVLVVAFLVLWRGANDEQNLLILSIAYALAANVPYVFASIVAFRWKLRDFRPSLRFAQISLAQKLFLISNRFFLVQILLMVITVTNEAFITRLIGAEQVVSYQVYYKLFSTVLVMYSLLTNPVWSSITKKWELLDWQGVMKNIKLLLGVAGMFTMGTVVMAYLLQPIVNVWLGSEAITVVSINSWCFVLYTAITLFSYAFTAVANAINKLDVQILCYLLGAITKYPLCLLLLRLHFDWSMIVLVNALIMLPLVIIQPITLKKEIQKFKCRCDGLSGK